MCLAVRRTLPELGNDKLDSLKTKKAITAAVKEHLEHIEKAVENDGWTGAAEWSGMSWARGANGGFECTWVGGCHCDPGQLTGMAAAHCNR